MFAKVIILSITCTNIFFFYLYICIDCGLVAHRTCAATGLPPCIAAADRPLSTQFKSVFGHGLCVLFDPIETPAPAMVINIHILL